MERAAVTVPAFTQGLGLWGVDTWGLFSLGLLLAACIAFGVALRLLMKSGRGPHLSRRSRRR